MATEQDILSISFDYKKTQEDAKIVIASIQGVLSAAKELADYKPVFNADMGYTQSKKGADDLSKSLKSVAKEMNDYNKSRNQATNTAAVDKEVAAYEKLKGSVAAATNEAKNLAAEFGADSEQAIKAAKSADELRVKLKQIDDLSTGKASADKEKEIQKIAAAQEKAATRKAELDEAELKRAKALQEAETARAAKKAKSDEVTELVSKNTVKQSELKVEAEVIRVRQQETILNKEISKSEVEELRIITEKNKIKQQEVQTEIAVIKILQEEEKVLQQIARTKTDEARIATEPQKQITEAARQQTEASKKQTESSKRDTEASKQAAAAKIAEAKAQTEASKQADLQAKTAVTLTKEQERQQKAAEKKAEQAQKAAKAEQKAIDDLDNEYKQLSIAYTEAANKAKQYVLTLGANHPVSVQAVKDAKQMADTLLALDKSVGQSQRNVGNYPTTLQKVGAGFKSFGTQALQAIGVFGAVNTVISAVSGIFNLNKELEVSVQNLSAITGAAGKDLKFLKDAAVDLSTKGAGSAKDYVEAMKLIGSAKPELLSAKEDLVEVTKAAKLLSEASGLELPDAATRLTDALNQFGEPASRASVYIDALAAASKAGAAEVPQITEALLRFGAIAKSSNIDIFESSAAIELLADKGLKGADAGTALRNAFIKLSAVEVLPKEALAQLKSAGVNTDILKDKSRTLGERLKELSKIKDNDNALTKVFGEQNLVAGQILLQNIPRYEELTKQIKEQGVALDQATKNTDTIAFKWQKLKNTFAAPFLEDGQNAKGVKRFLDDLSNGIDVFGKGMDRVVEILKVNFSSALVTFKNSMSDLKGIFTLDFAGVAKNQKEREEEKKRSDERKRQAKELAQAETEADSIVKGIGREKLADQKKLLVANEALLESSKKKLTELRAAYHFDEEAGRKATAEFVKNSTIVQKLRVSIAKAEADAAKIEENGGGGSTDLFGGLSATEKKNKKAADEVAEAIKKLRAELSALQKQSEAGLITVDKKDEDSLKAYESTIKKLYELGASNDTPIVKQLILELSPVSIRVMEAQIKDFAQRNSTKVDLLPPPEEAKKRLDNIRSYVDDEAGLYDEILQRQLLVQQTAALNEEKVLEDKLKNGKISREKYENELLQIQLKYTKLAAVASIEYLEKEVSLYEAGTQAREEAEQRLAAARVAFSKNANEQQKHDNDELIAEIQRIQSAFNDVSGVAGGIVDIGITKQKNALQELEDLQQKNYQNEIERINGSTLSEAQKADKLKLLEATRQAQKETFDRKNREAERKKAAFDKATAIASIVLETALAVVHQLATGDPFTAFARAAIVGALGAAKLAVAIATPLPKYAKGLQNSPKDHIGVFGEAGPEIVHMPGQKPFIADKETVSFIPKGTNITPITSNQINNIMYKGMLKQTAATVAKPDRSEMLLTELVKETRKNNGKKVQFNAHIKYDTTWDSYKKKYYS